MAKAVTVRTSLLWRSLVAIAIGAGLLLRTIDVLSGQASTWDWIVFAGGCGLLLFLVFATTEVVLTEAGIRVTSEFRFLKWRVRRKESPLLPWREVNAVFAVTPRWLPLKMVMVRVGGRVFFLGTYWTSFEDALVFVVAHVEDEVIGEDAKALSKRHEPAVL